MYRYFFLSILFFSFVVFIQICCSICWQISGGTTRVEGSCRGKLQAALFCYVSISFSLLAEWQMFISCCFSYSCSFLLLLVVIHCVAETLGSLAYFFRFFYQFSFGKKGHHYLFSLDVAKSFKELFKCFFFVSILDNYYYNIDEILIHSGVSFSCSCEECLRIIIYFPYIYVRDLNVTLAFFFVGCLVVPTQRSLYIR